MADTLEELLAQVGAFKAGSQQATQQAVAAIATQADLSTQQGDIYKIAAEDEATVASAKLAAGYQTQLARVKAANAFGVNLKNSSEVITDLAASAERAYTVKQNALAKIAEKDSVTFLSNPLGYISNMFTINGDIAQHNLANAQVQAAEQRIQAINANAQSTIQTQNAIEEPLTAASMAAATRLAANTANLNAVQAQINTIGYNVKGIEYGLTAKKEALALGFQAQGASNAAAQLQMSRERMAQDKIEFSLRQKQYARQEADENEKKAIGQSVIDTVNLGRKALLGSGAAPLDDIGGKLMLQTLRGKGTLSTEYQKYYDAGERTRLTGNVVYGSSPSAAISTLTTLPVKLNPTQAAVKNILAVAATDTSTALQNSEMSGKNANPVFTGMDKKDKNTIDRAFNGRAQQILNAKAAVVIPGDADNPYQIASINQLAANSPTVQALPVYQKVLAPLVKSGVMLNDPKQIVSLIGEAVAKGKITHKEAIELTTIYHVGVTTNLAMRNIEGFGLIPSNSYNATVETNPNAFSPNEVVDMTRPDAVSRALVKLQSARLQQQMMDGTRSMTPKFNKFTSQVGENISEAVAPALAPQPQAAAALQRSADEIGNSVDQFFNTLPTANKPYFGPAKDKSRQEVSGKITPQRGN